MANSKSKSKSRIPMQNYGTPLFNADWIPYGQVRSKLSPVQSQVEQSDSAKDEISSTDNLSHLATGDATYVVLAGGGGPGNTGIRNAVLVANFDFHSNSLSPLPVYELDMGSDCPYRMVVHPGADGIICAFSNSCRYFEWDTVESAEGHHIGLKASDRVLTSLEDIGQQLALAFNMDGSILATGGEDGNIRVYRWPSMEVIIHDSITHSCVKYLSFSPDGNVLVSLGSSGPAKVWDLSSSAVVASLPKENDEKFSFCGFSQSDNGDQVLYIAAQKGDFAVLNGGKVNAISAEQIFELTTTDAISIFTGERKRGTILSFDATSWKRISSKVVTPDAICSFNVSSDGQLLAVGTNEDVLVISSRNLRIQMQLKKAHDVVVTSLAFSRDSRALVSASLDHSARVTVVEENGTGGGLNVWIMVLVIVLAIAAAYFLNTSRQ